MAFFSAGLDHLRRKRTDRKSTRLNSSHQIISYAVFCLKKKKNQHNSDRDGSAKPLREVLQLPDRTQTTCRLPLHTASGEPVIAVHGQSGGRRTNRVHTI